MRFAATVDVDLPAEVVERAPTFWDGCRELLGGHVDLETEIVRSRLAPATVLYQLRAALDALGIDNARALVVDGVVVFEDDKRRPGDLPDLMLAFADHVLLQTNELRELRLSVEHQEGGLFFEIEARTTLEHARDEPAARVSIIGRVLELAPGADEDAAAYRRRIERLVADANVWTAVKVQFATFVSRVEQALGTSLPGASLRTTARQLAFDLAAEMDRPVDPAPRANDVAQHRVVAHAPRPTGARESVIRRRSGSPDTRRRGAVTRDASVSLEQRIAVAVAGPPPSSARLRAIEELQDELVTALALHERESLDAVPPAVVRGLEELNRLIEQHNRFAPIERNLSGDPASGGVLPFGEPRPPRARVSLDDLRRLTADARSRSGG